MAIKHLFSALALFSFAGQVLALNISLGGSLGNVTAQQMLEFPSGPYLTPCVQQCNNANSTIANCNDDTCLCSQVTGQFLQECEQCLFEQLIDMNIKMPDPRVGSNVMLAAYVAACQSIRGGAVPSNVALQIPANWDGPTDIVLNTPATVFVVGFGAILGGSAIYLLWNM